MFLYAYYVNTIGENTFYKQINNVLTKSNTNCK